MFKATHKGRATTLSKTLLTAGLLGAAALSTLGAGSAQAACATSIFWADWAGGSGNPLTCGDKTYRWLSTAVVGDLNAARVSAEDFEPIYLFNVDKPFSNLSYDFTYEVTVTDSSKYIDAVDFDTDAVPLASPPSIAKADYTFAGGNSVITLTSTNGMPDVEPVVGAQPKSMIVRNYYGNLDPNSGPLTGDGEIDTLENSFRQVPAPLPLLGVGAAFGSIRKLRKFSSQLKTFSMG
jgi:hypothetical protein